MSTLLFIQIAAGLGLLLSLYTLYLHWKSKREANYKAVCDLSDRMSCMKSIRSEEGKIFGIPNGVYGIGFYAAVGLATLPQFQNYLWPLAIIGMLFSFYFAYQLYFKVKTFCVVCTSTYLINLLLLFLAWPK
ncbi:MAG: vitamin K epoxide reductase family protein [Patescibacteria group bacterium]